MWPPNTFAPAPITERAGRAGVQQRPDSRFGMIAEERPEELLARVFHPAGSPELDRSVGVLEVARRRHRAEVDPAAEVGVSNETSVSLVAVTKDDCVAELSTHLAVVAN